VSKRSTQPSEDEIRAAIADTGSITAAAAHLGVTRQTLHRWLRDLAITVERRTRAA
jgi:transcriptional regulator of acetoin/glycerol metabolism